MDAAGRPDGEDCPPCPTARGAPGAAPPHLGKAATPGDDEGISPGWCCDGASDRVPAAAIPSDGVEPVGPPRVRATSAPKAAEGGGRSRMLQGTGSIRRLFLGPTRRGEGLRHLARQMGLPHSIVVHQVRVRGRAIPEVPGSCPEETRRQSFLGTGVARGVPRLGAPSERSRRGVATSRREVKDERASCKVLRIDCTFAQWYAIAVSARQMRIRRNFLVALWIDQKGPLS